MDRQTRFLDLTMIVLSIAFGVGSVVLLVIAGSAGYTDFGWPLSTILVWDTFLSLAFFVQHSGMVRHAFRLRVTSKMEARYHGAFYSFSSGVVLALVVIFWQRADVRLLTLEGLPLMIARILSWLAVALFVLSASCLRPFDPLGIGPIRAHLRGRAYTQGPFVLRGPYRWVRHPLYSCILVMFWTNPEVTCDRLLFNVLWTGWILIGTVLEERDLTREFGSTYTDYQKRVPMLIPWRGQARIAA